MSHLLQSHPAPILESFRDEPSLISTCHLSFHYLSSQSKSPQPQSRIHQLNRLVCILWPAAAKRVGKEWGCFQQQKPYPYYLNRWKLQQYLLVQQRGFEGLHLWSAANMPLQNNSFWDIFSVVFQSWFQYHQAEPVWKTGKYQGFNLIHQSANYQQFWIDAVRMLISRQETGVVFASCLHVYVKHFLTKIFIISLCLPLSWATSPAVLTWRH